MIPLPRQLTSAARVSLVLACVLASGCSLLNRNKSAEIDPAADAQALLDRAEKSLRIGNNDIAVAYYGQLMAFYPFSEQARQAQLDLMYAYYRNGEKEAAIQSANDFLAENPTHPRVDYAYYLKGLVYFERNRGPVERIFRVDLSKRPPTDLQQSFDNFRIVVTQFPDSPYVEDAHQRMVFLRNRLASYEIHVARYYAKRRAWVAAANRARFVIENFQQSPSVVPALQIQVSAYRELGLDDLAASSMRILEENYPEQAIAFNDQRKPRLRDRIFQRSTGKDALR